MVCPGRVINRMQAGISLDEADQKSVTYDVSGPSPPNLGVSIAHSPPRSNHKSRPRPAAGIHAVSPWPRFCYINYIYDDYINYKLDYPAPLP